MKKKFITIVAALVVMAAVSFGGAAQAAATTAPIWCGADTACLKDYVEPSANHQGYWIARRAFPDTQWIRLTLVAGWNNTRVAPITCAHTGACVVVWYKPPHQVGYYMARQSNGTTWVRLTEQ